MSYRIFLPLYFFAIYAGFIVPIPGTILARGARVAILMAYFRGIMGIISNYSY